MIIIVVLSILTLIFWLLTKKTEDYFDIFDCNPYFIGFVICVCVLCIVLIAIPIYRLSCIDFNIKYESTKNTISSINNINLFGVEACTYKIFEINQELAGYKYWNNTILDIFINDKVANLPFLK